MASFECDPDRIRFAVTFADATVVKFDWEEADGCTFRVTTPRGANKKVTITTTIAKASERA